MAGETDSNEIDVHDATVRREPGRTVDSQGVETRENQEHFVADDSATSKTSLTKSQEDKAIEEAKTVISASHGSSVPSQPADGGSPAEVARVLLGHQLDHFFLENLIGGGGMGAVFKARDTRLDRTVAIKVIPRVGEDAELQRRFRNEAQSAARLDHPNIARVYDVGQHGGWHYIVFEYIDGINLRDLVHRDGVLSVDDAVYYTRQVAEALEHAHRRGVVHRDIKPSNVLITTSGQAKLVDMGLARAQQLEMSEDMTASGVTLGTFDYISPEQAKDPRDADVRSDIYSLGCTLYFALTGRAPYPSGTVLQKLLSHGSSPPPDPRKVRRDLSNNLVAVLHKMLAKQPADRYRRPLDLISDLYQLAELERLPRSISAGSIAIAPTNRFARLVEYHLPWVAALLLLFLSAGWMQILSSASSDLELTTAPPRPDIPQTVSGAGAENAVTGEQEPNEPLRPQAESSDSNRPAVDVSSGIPMSNTNASATTPAGSTGSNAANPGLGGNNGTLSPTALADGTNSGGSVSPADTSNAGKGANGPGTSSRSMPGSNLAGPVDAMRNSATTGNGSGNGNVTSDSASSSSSQTTRTPTGRALKIVRVATDMDYDSLQVIPEDRLVVESLEEAFLIAERDLDLAIIEVQGTIQVTDQIKLPRRGLTIRGISEQSVLDFGVWAPGDSDDLNGQWLFDLGSNNLELENLHVVWQIPSMAMSSGSIFRLAGGNTIRLTNCSITIDDPDGSESANAFIYLPDSMRGNRSSAPLAAGVTELTGSSISSGGVSSVTVGLSRLVAIQLKNCVVRGGMNFLEMERAGLLELKWDNGLLCVDGAMVKASGSEATDEFSSSRARIIMDDVTAVLGAGLVGVELQGTYAQPFVIDREANRCVFVWRNGSALVDIRGLSGESWEDRLLMLRGSDNHYDTSGDASRELVTLQNDEGEVIEQLVVADMLGMNPPRWLTEQAPQGVVTWSTSLPEFGGLHRAGPEDYGQEGVVLPGFRMSELPKLTSP